MRLSYRLIVVGALLASLGAPALAAAKGVKATYVQGICERSTPKAWQPLKKGDILANGTRVRTGAAGRAELSFTDGTTVRLAPGSNLTLVLDRQNGPKQQSFLRLALGRVWAKVAKGRGQFAITGPQSVAAVTGTVFAVEAGAKSTGTSVYEGGVGVQLAPPEGESAADSVLKSVPAPSLPAVIGKPTVVDKPYAVVSPPVRVVAGPHPVSRDEWLQIVANQRVEVGANGVAQVSDLDAKSEAGDEWVQWNRSRDVSQSR